MGQTKLGCGASSPGTWLLYAHGAVRQIKGFIEEGYRIAVDVDLSKFFDRVNHNLLMNRLRHFIADKGLLKLIGRYLRAGVMIKGKRHPTPEGVPQGGPLSPLLANILLGDRAQHLIPWAWGVNGCASVLSAVLATLLAIHFGFTVVVVLALLLYGVAALIMTTSPESRRPESMEMNIAP